MADIYELSGHDQISENIISYFNEELGIELKNIIVFGSYGAGSAVVGESDIDLLLVVSVEGVLSETELDQYYKKTRQELLDSDRLTNELPISPEIDLYFCDPSRVEETLGMYSAFGSEDYISLWDSE